LRLEIWPSAVNAETPQNGHLPPLLWLAFWLFTKQADRRSGGCAVISRKEARRVNSALALPARVRLRLQRAPGPPKDPKGFQERIVLEGALDLQPRGPPQALAGLPLACATLCLRARWQMASSPSRSKTSRLADSGAQMCATLAPGYASTTTRVPIGVF